ncbi:hypothetical protein JCM19231_2044 [Vibrio ishigakensis]|uniref:Uncharacterized protein n=1 Tax=Vibrio ishigakensis TaxID=1481914 RepID=A0A0B8NSS1_9VIBR|nr:hypothetical protein JCM19231_2044 [Vibrio ishigakensis]
MKSSSQLSINNKEVRQVQSLTLDMKSLWLIYSFSKDFISLM